MNHEKENRHDQELAAAGRRREPAMRKAIAEFRTENPDMVRAAAEQKIIEYREQIIVLVDTLKTWPKETAEHKILQNNIDRLATAIAREKIKLKPTSKNNITPDMIERAKQYPIEKLIPSTGRPGNVLCIAHEDHNPSMSIKNNRAHCFVCGFKEDTIGVYQFLNRCSFYDAVKSLQ
jgi:hypothetical protein